ELGWRYDHGLTVGAIASGEVVRRASTDCAGREEAPSLSVVREKTSIRTRCPSSHTRNIRHAGCKLHEVPPSTQRLRVIGPSTASITSRKEIESAGRPS